jgi:hypothetical protein|tara:strand:- start:93 stop:428 length:336 start_codon:yes stop_codon:yes gene_type:complete
MARKKSKHCAWCGKPTNSPEQPVTDTPILEFMEDKINMFGRDKIWGDNGDWSNARLDPEFEAELLVYDNLLCTVSDKVVCDDCISADNELYKKYYGGDTDNENEIVFDADF